MAPNKNRPLNDELLRGSAFAVGDAKPWDRLLDVPLKKGSNQFTNVYTTIEDMPEGQIRKELRRRALAVLVDESDRTSQEAGCYRRSRASRTGPVTIGPGLTLRGSGPL